MLPILALWFYGTYLKPTLHHHELYQFWIIIMTRKIWKYNPELHSYSWLVLDWSLGFRIQNSGFLIHILCFMLYWFLHESKNSREWKWSWIKHRFTNSGWIQDKGHNSWSRMSIFWILRAIIMIQNWYNSWWCKVGFT